MTTKFLIELPKLLSHKDCNSIINNISLINNKLENANHSDELDYQIYGWSNINGYHRAQIVDYILAEKLFNTIKNLIPLEYNGYIISHINPCLRLLKYNNHGMLPIHYDSQNIEFNKENNTIYKTIFILSIYLNDKFQGGNTDFINFDTLEVEKSIKPKTGKGICFSLDYSHRGNKTNALEDNKILMKCDIMGYNNITHI